MKRVILLFGLILCFILTVNACSTKNRCYRIADMNQPRANHHSILLDNGNVLLFGGEDLGSDSIELYDHKTKTFKVIYEGKDARFAYYYKLANGNLFIVAGKKPLLYDQKTNKLTPVKDIPIDITDTCNINPHLRKQYLLTNGKKIGIYNFLTLQYKPIAKKHLDKEGFCQIFQKHNPDIYLLDSTPLNNQQYSSDEIYNHKTNFIIKDKQNYLKELKPFPPYDIVKLPDNSYLKSGGGRLTRIYKNDIEDLPHGNWKDWQHLNMSLLITNNNTILAIGGTNDYMNKDRISHREIFQYNPESNEMTVFSRMTTGRVKPGVIELLNGDILITGGYIDTINKYGKTLQTCELISI